MNGFREIKHTADIGLEVHANSIEKLFIFALNGYYKLALFDNYSSSVASEFNFSLIETNYEDLLITFLSELNYLLMVKNQVINPIHSIEILRNNHKIFLDFKGQLNNLVNPDKDITTEIKAVTYHQVKVTQDDGIFKTKIFFDI
jgi:SHS2 domain-containing protein